MGAASVMPTNNQPPKRSRKRPFFIARVVRSLVVARQDGIASITQN
jgi:hypothetical protein